MKVVIALEQRFLGTPDGAVWTDGLYPRPFWDRYLAAFDEVTILARVRAVDRPSPPWVRVDDAVVHVHAVPDYLGPAQYLRRRSSIREAVREATALDGVFVLRVPGQIGTLAASMLAERGRPFTLEVVGDPRDAFAGGASHHPLRAFFRTWYPRNLRLQCARARNVLYVTQRFLQESYPPRVAREGEEAPLSLGISDAELGESAFLAGQRPLPTPSGRPLRLVSIGSMNQPYKGFADLITAVGLCRSERLEVELTLIGDGPLRPELERSARSAGLGEHVRFAGQLPAGQAVRDELDRADIYVQPSLLEGLPRALVEAMARGCPCIATRVGGIPELLPAEDLVPPRQPARLAAAIQALAGDPGRLREASRRNLEVARTFSEETLAPRRLAFYRMVIATHQAWLEKQGRGARRPPSVGSIAP